MLVSQLPPVPSIMKRDQRRSEKQIYWHSAYRIGWFLKSNLPGLPWIQELRLPKTVNASESTPFRTAENASEDARKMQDVRSRTLLFSSHVPHWRNE